MYCARVGGQRGRHKNSRWIWNDADEVFALCGVVSCPWHVVAFPDAPTRCIHQAEVWAYVRGYQPRVDGAFRGTLKSTVQCLECSHESHAIEPFLDISVPIRTAPAPSPPKPKGGTSTGKSSGATRLFRGKLKGKSRQLDPGTEGSSEGDRKVHA